MCTPYQYIRVDMQQVVVINRTAVGLGVPCSEKDTLHMVSLCEWDSISYMQPHHITGHRQLMLHCLGVTEQPNVASQHQHQTQVTLVQRLFKRSRSMLNTLEMESRISATGAHVNIMNMEGVWLLPCAAAHKSLLVLSADKAWKEQVDIKTCVL